MTNHQWMFDSYKDLEHQLVYFVRTCMKCGLASKVSLTKMQLVQHNSMTQKVIEKWFEEHFQPSECSVDGDSIWNWNEKFNVLSYDDADLGWNWFALNTQPTYLDLKKHLYINDEYTSAQSKPDVLSTMIELMPDLQHRRACPVALCRWKKARLANAIIHLNDRHKWTREAIADWLETLDVDLSFPSEVG